MSPDLRRMLHEAAPKPQRDLDTRAVARRARRITSVRALVTVAFVGFAVAGGSVIAAAPDRPGPTKVVGDPEPPETPAPPPRRAERDHPHVPDGPRHTVVSGTHGDDWDERWRGKSWRVLVWGDDRASCMQVAYEDEPKDHNRWCSANLAPERVRATLLGASTSFFTGSENPDEFFFVVGMVGPRVEGLELRPDDRSPLPIPLHEAPEEAGVPYRYYAATLPRFEVARIAALDDGGRTLETKRICGPGCREDEDEDEQAEVARYEAAPVSTSAKAAVFAISAVGQADLIDAFGTRWSYRGISRRGDTFVARFHAARCFPPKSRSDASACTGRFERTSVTLELEEDLFVVTGVEGEMTSSQRAALLADEEEVPADRQGWRLVAHSFARGHTDRDWGVSFALAWTADLPAPPRYGSTCWMSVYDRGGRLITRGPDLPFSPGEDESSRVSALSTRIQTSMRPGHVGVHCDPPTRR